MKVLLLLFFSILHYTSPFEFKNSNQPGVEFGEETQTSLNIIIDEDNEGRINKILIITEVKGDLYMNYNSQVKELLQPLLAQASEEEYALIVNQLDFENLRAKSIEPKFAIDFYENGTTSEKTLKIEVKNIDDENPTLTSTHCVMNENIYIGREDSICVLHISDPDGWLNSIDFGTIIGVQGNSSIFEIEYASPPSDDTYEYDVHLVLQSGLKLDYEEENFYVLEIKAKDKTGHPTTTESVTVFVQVGDVPDQLPIWITSEDTFIITEETATTIQIRAVDGDFGVNSDINYMIIDSREFLYIDTQTGLITVDAIDRDRGFDNITFTVMAYETEDAKSSIEATFTLIVNDIDDNIPEIDISELNITISEHSTTIDTEIIVTDLDSGKNAIFTTLLNASSMLYYVRAFDVIPTTGYGNTSLKLIITAPDILDYEDPNARTIKFQLFTFGLKTPTNTDTLNITINLIDINDNPPFFDQDEYMTTVPENVTVGTVIANIQASDKDAEDENEIEHEIVGSFGKSVLQIEKLGGNVTIIKDNVFDYEKQSEYFFQIRAIDKNGRSTITLLIVNLQDVNDEPPRIIFYDSIIEVEEEKSKVYVFNTNITARDKDATAKLSFSIDWYQSFATKNSRTLNYGHPYYYKCVDVKTLISDDSHTAAASLYYTGENISCDGLDYEIYDTLFLYLTVVDTNTDINDEKNTVLITITIININDDTTEPNLSTPTAPDVTFS